MKFLRDGNIWLWAALIICAVYLILWIAGVRFPPVHEGVQATVVIDDDIDEDVEQIDESISLRDDFDAGLPVQPEIIEDGRDPDAPLL